MGKCRICGKPAGLFRSVHKECLESQSLLTGEGPIQSAIAGLIRQRTVQNATGERPETMLIPHKKIKLEIMVKAYENDLKKAVEKIAVANLPENEFNSEKKRMEGEVASLIYNLRRERSNVIDELFEDMKKQRNDLQQFEKLAREENTLFSIVSSDDLGLD